MDLYIQQEIEWLGDRLGAKMKTYPLTEVMEIRLNNDFTYHSPKAELGQNERYIEMRAKAKELAVMITMYTPPSREQSTALTNLEQAIFWANAAIARNEK